VILKGEGCLVRRPEKGLLIGRKRSPAGGAAALSPISGDGGWNGKRGIDA